MNKPVQFEVKYYIKTIYTVYTVIFEKLRVFYDHQSSSKTN